MHGIVIAVNSGVGLRLVGGLGQYVSRFEDAMNFMDEIDAYRYIEKHGLEKFASVRKFKKSAMKFCHP